MPHIPPLSFVLCTFRYDSIFLCKIALCPPPRRGSKSSTLLLLSLFSLTRNGKYKVQRTRGGEMCVEVLANTRKGEWGSEKIFPGWCSPPGWGAETCHTFPLCPLYFVLSVTILFFYAKLHSVHPPDVVQKAPPSFFFLFFL